MSNITNRKLTTLQELHVSNSGKIMAPLYFNFAHFVKKHARHPIFVSYRSGHPIKHALDHIGVPSNELWINTSITKAKHLITEKVREYCDSLGLRNPYTFVDNGYEGIIPSRLKDTGRYGQIQPIFLTGYKRIAPRVKGTKIMVSQPWESIRLKHGISNSVFNPITDNIEEIPKQYSDYYVDNLERNSQGKLVMKPIKESDFDIEIFNAFFAGMKDGYSFCDTNSKKFKKYLELIIKSELVDMPQATESEKDSELMLDRSHKNLETVQDIYF